MKNSNYIRVFKVVLRMANFAFCFAFAFCPPDCFAQSYSYTPALSRLSASLVSYSSVSTNELALLSPWEKKVLDSILRKSARMNMSSNVFYASTTVSGSVYQVVTAIAPLGINHLCRNENYPADAIVDDLCALTNLSLLNMTFTTLENESFRKLARLKKWSIFVRP